MRLPLSRSFANACSFDCILYLAAFQQTVLEIHCSLLYWKLEKRKKNKDLTTLTAEILLNISHLLEDVS